MLTLRLALATPVACLPAVAAACGGDGGGGSTITADGASTVGISGTSGCVIVQGVAGETGGLGFIPLSLGQLSEQQTAFDEATVT